MPKSKKERYEHTLKMQEFSRSREHKRIQCWCDGSVFGNGTENSCGGSGFVMFYKEYYKEVSIPVIESTTNQRTEMIAVISALQQIKHKHIPVDIFSDSGYVINCFNEKWYESWESNGWKNSQKKHVENKDLWEIMLAEYRKFKEVKFHKVNGHCGVELNDIADKLAVDGTKSAKEILCIED